MSFADDEELRAFVARDDWLPHVTAEAVADALQWFPLQPRYSMDWLATAVRRALAATIPNASDHPGRQSNSETKQELKRLASRAGKAWRAIQECSDAARRAAWDYAWHNSPLEGGGTDIGDGIVIGNPADSSRFHTALVELDWLSQFLRRTAESIESQRPRWPENEWREIRTERAQFLVPIFQTAFGLQELTGFGDFYQRIVSLAFDEGDIRDFEKVISDARRRHREAPVTFADGVIPAPY
jgi:hypothetical protein